MSECIVPSWNLSHQRQEVAGEEGNRTSSHVHNQPHPAYVVPMSNYEVAELTWENGQLAMHGLAGILPAPAGAAAAGGKVPTFVRTGGTLESIVHQATCYKNNEKTTQNQLQETAADLQGQTNPITAATPSPLDGKRVQNTAGNIQLSPPGLLKKRLRSSESDQCGKYNFNGSKIKGLHEDQVVATGAGSAAAAAEKSGCASASATFCRDATMMTWNSFESPGSFKTKTTDEDSAYHDGSENRDEELETKEETFRSHSARRSRAAMIHNQSERRRRDRINQKMKALQKLVPNANKTDKASMLDEVIEYLKQLQTQVHMMSTRTVPQMMMNPLAIQQHQQQQLQMSLLARMGMGVGLGMGMGMLDMNAALARSASSPFQSAGLIPTAPVTPTFVPPHFVVPATAVPTCAPSQAKSPAETTTTTTKTTSVPFSDPYAIYLAQVCQHKHSNLNIKQSMNMEFYNKMAALYRQQATNQATQATSNQPQENFIQRE